MFSKSQHHSPGRTLLGQVPLLFPLTHHTTNDTTPRPHLLERARNSFSGTTHRRNDEGSELQEHHQNAVDVPLAKGHFVSTPCFHFRRSTLATSYRGITRRENYL